MRSETEITERYRQLHEDLTVIYYQQDPPGQLSKEDFDQAHALIWDGCEKELTELRVKRIKDALET